MIDFENDTQNFETKSAQALSPLSLVTTSIISNKNSKRLNLPQRLRQRFIEQDEAMLIYNYDTNTLYIDFKYNNETEEDYCEYKSKKIVQTGRGFFITIPSAWIKDLKPTKAQLIQSEMKKTKYRIDLYD